MEKEEDETYEEDFTIMTKEVPWRILNIQNKIDLLKELKGYEDLVERRIEKIEKID
jgi:hypothetical protein